MSPQPDLYPYRYFLNTNFLIMTILIRTLFLSLVMVCSIFFVNAATVPVDAPAGGTIDIIQVGLTVQVDIDRSLLSPQLQNKRAVVTIRNAQRQLVQPAQTIFGNSVTFSMENLPEGTYSITLKVGGYTETENLVFEEAK